MGRPIPVAASSAVELALVGPARPATVLAVTAQALYLEVADADRTVICLASDTAVRVPCAAVIESRARIPYVPVGTPARVGNGTISIAPGVPRRAAGGEEPAYRVQRWWRPPRPRGLGAVAPSRLAAVVRWLTGQVADPLDPAGRVAVADLVEALASGSRPEAPVSALLGRGPGLTPTGDDVLAGTLVTLRALGSPAATPLAQAVRVKAPAATTVVSAGLLRHAVDGRCIPELADLLAAVGGAAGPAGGLPRAAGTLLAVGHCSGAGLLHGVLVGVAIAHARLAHGVVRPVAA